MHETADRLRQDLAASRPAYDAKGYPPELRARVGTWALAQHARGAGWPQLARELGVSRRSVRDWAAKAAKAETIPGATFLPVRVEAPRASSGSGLRLTTPGGYVVEGLDPDELLVLLERLG